MKKRTKIKVKIVFGRMSTREKLCMFFNELQEVMIKAFGSSKKKPTKVIIKKVCKPIFDKWEKIFNGVDKWQTLEMEIPENSIKKIKLPKK